VLRLLGFGFEETGFLDEMEETVAEDSLDDEGFTVDVDVGSLDEGVDVVDDDDSGVGANADDVALLVLLSAVAKASIDV
jgi:hypothetical protein